MAVAVYGLRKIGTVSARDERVEVKDHMYTRRVLRIILSTRKLKDFAAYRRFTLYISEVDVDGRKMPCLVLVPAE